MSANVVRMKRIVVLSIVVALCLIGASSVARADSYAYYAGASGGFGLLDLDTGVYTPIGNTEINNQPVVLAGLGVANGTLYGAPLTAGPPTATSLYSVNPLNGGLTYIGGAFNDFGGFGSTTSGLYALTGGNTAYLYSIDPATGATTGNWPTTTQRGTLWQLSTNSNTLYYAGNNYLYTLNTSNGATQQASNPFGAGIYIGPMVEEGGILYGVNGNYQIYTIDPSSGVATFKAKITGATQICFGLAPVLPPLSGDLILPTGQQVFESFSTVSPLLNTVPSHAKPIGIGSVADGGSTFRIQIGLDQVSGPMDVYFAISGMSLGPNIFLLTSTGTFQSASEGVVPWMSGLTGPINMTLLPDTPTSLLPPGTYTLYLLIAPHGSLTTFYLWTTSFTI